MGYLHQNRVMHRDLKPDNILMCKDGYLKGADFGMARECKLPLRQYTPGMCTLWYRAPELLLLSTEYSTSVDMWSIGCIFAEFIDLWPLCLGKSESDQLKKIISTLPLVEDIKFDEYAPSGLRKELKHEILSDSGLVLLQRMFTYDPKRRVSAKEALRHQYFDDEPVTISPDEFLKSLDLEDDHEDTDSDTGDDGQSGSDTEDEEHSGSDTEDAEQSGSDTGDDKQSVSDTEVADQSGSDTGDDEQSGSDTGDDEQSGSDTGDDEQSGSDTGDDEQSGSDTGNDEHSRPDSEDAEQSGSDTEDDG
ncbi:cyclin-dependent kinase 2 homolog [Spodoptera frugiperda]|uniref:Cyclin-dependent kinase 2 homolog n=1 Tax=Spodoptera frugiperda TaxID=7108 RepID=A0A9R0DSR9_SPOFR|nr:cyclin-dependent kinase 2 homolog [Spodoptera frugiperda]